MVNSEIKFCLLFIHKDWNSKFHPRISNPHKSDNLVQYLEVESKIKTALGSSTLFINNFYKSMKKKEEHA